MKEQIYSKSDWINIHKSVFGNLNNYIYWAATIGYTLLSPVMQLSGELFRGSVLVLCLGAVQEFASGG